jgi:hypothetical protein
MKDLGYGQSYRYAHDYEGAHVEQDYLPESLRGRVYYRPTDRGLEAGIQERLAAWRRKTDPSRCRGATSVLNWRVELSEDLAPASPSSPTPASQFLP